MIETQEEMKCPKCNGDMKEYVTRFGCRGCEFEFVKQFQITPSTYIKHMARANAGMSIYGIDLAKEGTSDYTIINGEKV